MRIQHNMSAFHSYGNLKTNNHFLANHIEKLVSGYQINRAGDDAAGLAISQKMRAQISSLNMSQHNITNAISFVQTGEGGLQEIHSILERMTELAQQSSNDIYQATERNKLQQEFENLKEEIDRIAESTQFNNISLLKQNNTSSTAKSSMYIATAKETPFMTNLSESSELIGTPVCAFDPSTYVFRMPKMTVGAFTVEGDMANYSYNASLGILTVYGDVTIHGTGAATTDRIVMANGVNANVTLDNVNIDMSKDGGAAFDTKDAQVNLTLTGTNSLKSGENRAGLQVGANSSLVITKESTGSLNAFGGNYAAGIGGGNKAETGSITINGGTITATGIYCGAGIGAGNEGIIGDITINGGTITAKATHTGAGIGTGDKGTSKGTIKITGGVISATGAFGAGIGSGQECMGGIIDISGGTITAVGDGGAGIGSGDESTRGEKIYISGGTIKASGGYLSSGIGGGFGDKGTQIHISGGNIEAVGGQLAAGIGGSPESKDITIDISGGIIKATGGDWGAGIGNAYFAEGGKIDISGGTITAIGGENAAGIGGAYEAESYGEITIRDNAVVTAKGDGLAQDIGGGQNYEDTGYVTNGTVNKTGGLIIEGNQGKLYGDVTIYDDFTIEAGTTVTVDNDKELNIVNGTQIENFGIIVNNGTIYGQVTNKISGSIIGNQPKPALCSATVEMPLEAVLEADKLYEVEIDGVKKSVKTDKTGKLLLFLNAGEHDIKLMYDNDRYEAKVTAVQATNMNIITNRTTYHAEIQGVTLGADKEYTVIVNGKNQTFRTDSTGKLTVKGLENGKNIIKITANGIQYGSEFMIDHSDTAVSVDRIENNDTNGDSDSEIIYPNQIYFQIGADKEDKISITLRDMDCKSIGIVNSSIFTQESALRALSEIKTALDMISEQRGHFGAIQNRLEHTQTYLGVSIENLSHAEGRIRDTDMAKSMMEYTKESILNQSAQAILTQANQAPEKILELLK